MSFLFPAAGAPGSQGFAAAPASAAPGMSGAPPVPFNVDVEVAKVQAKQFGLMMGQAGLMLCVCTVAMCLMRPRDKSGDFYVNSDDEDEEEVGDSSGGYSSYDNCLLLRLLYANRIQSVYTRR